MAQSTEPLETAVDLQMVREFLERYFTIESEIKVLIAKKRQLVQVSRETLDALISEVEEKLPAPED